jgi:hypothetical protein
MKKNLLFLFAVIFMSSMTFAQSLSLSYEGETIDNTEVLVTGLASDFELVSHCDVTNLTDAPLNVKAKKIHLDMPTGTSSTFCWGLCFPPNTFESPNYIEIEGGATLASLAGLSGHFNPNGQEVEARIRYTVFVEDNPNDSASFIAVYSTIMSIEDHVNNLNVYPNPADDQVTVEYTSAGNDATLSIFNLVGQEVIIRNLNSMDNTLTIDVSDLSEGIYFYAVREGNQVIETKKLVIK